MECGTKFKILKKLKNDVRKSSFKYTTHIHSFTLSRKLEKHLNINYGFNMGLQRGMSHSSLIVHSYTRIIKGCDIYAEIKQSGFCSRDIV